MCKSRIATVLVAAMLVALVCGCTILRRGPTDEELITRTVSDYHAALAAKDLDKMMAAYSEDFEGENGAGKDEIRQLLGGAIDGGYLDDLEVNDADCEIKIEGDTATVGPVEYSSALGSMSFEFTMKREADGVWRIVESYAY